MKPMRMQFFSILIMVLALASMSLSQITSQKFSEPNAAEGPLLTLEVSVDSVNTYTSDAFTLAPYDGESFASYPLSWGAILSSDGTPHVMLTIEGSFGFDTWTAVDTVFANDSVKTFTSGTIDLNEKHFPYYRSKITGLTGNPRDCVLDAGIYARKRSY